MAFGAATRAMNRRGFSLIELLTTLVMVGLLVTIAAPNLRTTPTKRVRSAARQLVYAMDNARTGALATKKAARVEFDLDEGSYVRYLDENGDGKIKGSDEEMRALQGRGIVTLPKDVVFGLGSASRLPGDTASGPVTFDENSVDFDPRGLTVPFGTRGAIYLVHERDPEAVAAVSVSGAASFRLWTYRDGMWR